MEKKYKIRSGLPARIICTDRKDPDFPVVALVTDRYDIEKANYYTENLRYNLDDVLKHFFDLMEVSPYDDIKIDDPVIVYDFPEGEKHKRHFAGVNEKGQPLTWLGGRTSFTTDEIITWKYCEKVETNN